MVSITFGDARDIAAIMPIMNAAFDPKYGEAWTASQCLSLLAMPGSQLLLAAIENQIVGFALTRWVLDEEELLMIGVDPGFQRQGVATQIVASIISIAKNSGRQNLFLEVRANNSAANFYTRLGFAAKATRRGYYRGVDGQRFDATTMALNF
ncbi:ribosomal-protein-alanine N-acetyltransferase [Sphingorhabdus pulchriflava]|uniref:[Ribosomal protein bS18]-alanine N-acetyltransferase n=1 Tax=Sphingorhabdus pulchriflava TaxID=2292257 RepID=A0A371BIW0_9SPHN|nr:ribosomal protein S18-alanine N-acetyltransferase [Sphingorhabdus pulchriflava]RDV07498.1 ribosomal-protein-alanine N-acetyltransferase [Sphingorhabdus pulchriflava]